MFIWVLNTPLILTSNLSSGFCLIQIFTETCFQKGYKNLYFNSKNSTQYIQTSPSKKFTLKNMTKFASVRKIRTKTILVKRNLLEVNDLSKFKPLEHQSWTSLGFLWLSLNYRIIFQLLNCQTHKLLKQQIFKLSDVVHGKICCVFVAFWNPIFKWEKQSDRAKKACCNSLSLITLEVYVASRRHW